MTVRAFVSMALVFAAGAAHAESPRDAFFGVWETENAKSRVQIHECDDDRLCGSLVWTDSGKTDKLGRRILEGFVYERGRWNGGRIIDPRDGSSYKAKLKLDGRDMLSVKGCWFIFCGDQTWERRGGLSRTRPASEARSVSDRKRGAAAAGRLGVGVLHAE